jgi:hypothetical protein
MITLVLCFKRNQCTPSHLPPSTYGLKSDFDKSMDIGEPRVAHKDQELLLQDTKG